MYSPLSLVNELETLCKQPIVETDYQGQIDHWNAYMTKLDEIEGACAEMKWRGATRTVPMAVLERNVRRADSTKTIAFETKPEIVVHTDAFLMQNMKNYEERFCEPRVKLPQLRIFISIEWLERESLKLVMERLSTISISNSGV